MFQGEGIFILISLHCFSSGKIIQEPLLFLAHRLTAMKPVESPRNHSSTLPTYIPFPFGSQYPHLVQMDNYTPTCHYSMCFVQKHFRTTHTQPTANFLKSYSFSFYQYWFELNTLIFEHKGNGKPLKKQSK